MTSGVLLLFSRFSRVLRGFTPWALGILIIGGTLIALTAQHPQLASAAWYDDLFVYRRAIRFGNTGATVTDQKVLIAMNTSSTSGLIQDERMQTDCDDTRFTDANGRVLQYYINVSGGAGVGCNDASTDYYVLMPRIEGGGDTLIYLYYGNYNAVSASAGANFSQSTFSPTSGPSIAAEEAGTAPVLYWNLDEGYGTTANDLMIQRNNGTITGSWATDDLCVSGKCLQLNGSSHKVIKTYASDFELDVSSNSFTVSLWMRHASALSGTDTLVSRVSSGGYKIAASSGSFCFAIDDDASTFDPDDSACTTSTYNDSLWHYVTAVKNGTTSITLYVDGNQVAQDASLTGTGSLSGSSPEFDVGVDGSSNFFDGAIDEVKFYNTAKTVSQIKAEYSSRSATGEGTSSQTGSNQLPLSNGLVGYWRMDEQGQNDCDGTNDTCDVSGNVNHGAWNGNVRNEATTTKFGRGVWFDGTTDYVSVADSTSLSVTTQVSLGLWINSSSSVASESLVVKNNSYRLVTDANSNPVCQVSDGTTWQTAATSTTALTTSTWYHVGCSYDGQTIRVFVNGAETGRNALASAIGDNANALEFGRDAGATYTDFGGVLDEARLYNRALGPNEIAQLFTFGPAPVGWWTMDENTGTTSVNDSSGLDKTGTMNGSMTATSWAPGKYGSALDFDGRDDSISRADDADFDFSASDSFTLEAWFKHDTQSAGQDVMLSKFESTGGDGGYKFLMEADGDITCGVDTDNTSFPVDSATSTAATYDDNQWHHAACVKDGTSSITLYVDGLAVASDTSLTATGSYANDDILYIGRDGVVNGVTHQATVTGTNTQTGSAISVTSGTVTADSTSFYIAAIGGGNGPNLTVGSVTDTGLGLSWTKIITQCNSNTGAFAGSLWYGSGIPAADGTVTANLSTTGTMEGAEILVSRYSGVAPSNPIGGYGGDNTDNGSCSGGTTNSSPSVTINTTSGSMVYAAVQERGRTITWSGLTSRGVETASTGGDLSRVDVADMTADASSETASGTLNVAHSWAIVAAEIISSNNTWWNGQLDDVRVYRYARNSKQIIEDMLGGRSSVTSGGPNAGPAVYLKFDEQQGTTANNAVNPAGSGEWDGTITGADWRLPENNCKVNGCLTFSTATDEVSAGDTPFTDSLTAMTVSLWVSPTTLAASKGIVTKSNFSTQNSFAIVTGTASDEITAFIASSTSDTANYVVTSGFDLTTSTFSHLAMVYDGGLAASDRVKVYKNGNRVSTTVTGTISTSMTSGSTSTLTAGESGSATYQALDAHLDEVKIYSFALTPSEVLVDANAGSATALGGVLGVPGATPHDNEGFSLPIPIDSWSFDENTGSTVNDMSVNENQLTTGNSPLWVTGEIGSALDFNGSNQCAFDSTTTGAGATGDVTIAAWIFRESTTTVDRVIELNGTDETEDENMNYRLTVNQNTNTIELEWEFGAGTNETATSTSGLAHASGEWVHVAATRNVSTNQALFYENGSQLGSAVSFTNDPTGGTLDQRLFVAADGPNEACSSGNQFDGKIDELNVYGSVLTPAQIVYDYNRGAPISWYKFDECQGIVAFDSSLKPGPSTVDMSGGKPGNITIGSLGSQTSLGTCADGSSASAWNNGTTGKYSASLDFDGTDDVVTVANDVAIDMDAGLQSGFTISAWINPASAGESNLGQFWNKGTNSYCRTDNPSGSDLDIECNLDLATTDANVNVSAGATTGGWTHVAMTYDDASKITVYVNGQSRGTNTGSGATAADTSDLLIGGPSTANFDGRIDDVRIHTYEMTAAQILRLYNEGAAIRFGPQSGSP